MTNIYAHVNNTQTDCIGEVKLLNDNTYAVEGKFLWGLPYGLDLLANNYWGLRANIIHITDKIGPFNFKQDFLIKLENKKTKNVIEKNFLNHYMCNIYNLSQLCDAITNILPENSLTFQKNENDTYNMTVMDDFSLVLGRELVKALSLTDQASETGTLFSRFDPGKTYKAEESTNFQTIFTKDEIIYVCLNVIQTNIFGNKMEPILCSISPSQREIAPPGDDFHDLIQTPIRSMEIYFINKHGTPVYFNLQKPDDFIFSISFQLKSLILSAFN